MDISELDAALADVGIMPEVTAPDRRTVLEASSVQTFRRGRVLWRADTPSRGLYFVLRGRIRVVRARRGRQHLVHVSGPGATMGEAALFGAGRYPATAIVSRTATCAVLGPDAALGLVEECPSFARFLLERTAARVDLLVRRLEAQTLADVRTRLAGSLVGLAAESGDGPIDLPSPQSEWAEDLGTVREVLARELGALCGRGLVERVGRGRIEIRDESGLEAVALGRDESEL